MIGIMFITSAKSLLVCRFSTLPLHKRALYTGMLRGLVQIFFAGNVFLLSELLQQTSMQSKTGEVKESLLGKGCAVLINNTIELLIRKAKRSVSNFTFRFWQLSSCVLLKTLF